MSSSVDWVVVLSMLLLAGAASAQSAYPGIGRTATKQEVAAWDIDVRPDFKGLPKGVGTVAQGQEIWEARCASCHGVFGESNEVFTPLIGGTTAADMTTGHAARLNDPAFPGRTTMMKLATLSTLWDYINRAMPWNAPKSLSSNQVYAVTAYMLNMAGVVPDDYVLSDANMARTQALLPNRQGLTTDHGLWPGKGLGRGGGADVTAAACMQKCAPPAVIVSSLPAFARNNHGNLAAQQRGVGPQRGADTTRPAPSTAAEAQALAATVAPSSTALAEPMALAQKNGCTACHGLDSRIVGPGLREIADKYAARSDRQAYLARRIRAGSQGVWGVTIPMPAQTLPDAELQAIAQWLSAGAGR